MKQRFEEAEAERLRMEQELSSVQERLEKTRQDNLKVMPEMNKLPLTVITG